ncbi:hypothetical protein BAUCODRAFT_63420 [Baudoinia panamericana UAMH 10762]|uniref:DNA-directed RNA polymerase III subunit RPC6 n=1 Tax=Baudoinia panamericana (strain UAMH 10762) TaxID=717646 RepID=M2LYS5_BAUPA|nr:uncharacterized protein BAUCODRAFT_63420 [Baudoinia panamericana UAMH 10762]EMC99857.1 hypothetical protein BAUCODRAFT_63420 [Baudoinia panamericana UAMH 10762]
MLNVANASPEGLRKVFFQADVQIIAEANAKTVEQLLALITELQGHCLIRTSRLDRALCWSTRPRDAAKQILALGHPDRMLYEYVEDAHRKGIWLRDLRKRSGIQGQSVDKAMNRLENARLVKVIRNVKSPMQKTYLLSHLMPTDDVTGGSFFDSGDLDESLIDEIKNLIIFKVRMDSWSEQRVHSKSRRGRSPAALEDGDEVEYEQPDHAVTSPTRKRKRTNDIEDLATLKRQSYNPDTDPLTYTQLPYPAYSKSYPTTDDIMTWLKTTPAIRATKQEQLTVDEIQRVLDVLVWDDKLEKVGAGYRSVRGVVCRQPGQPSESDEEDGDEDGVVGLRKGNGLTEAPCGRCPVFDLCEEGGPINASSCVYWAAWIEKNV